MLSPLVLAEFLGVSTKTLERWRKDGSGPTARQLPGSALWRYARSDVGEWLERLRTDR
ncbi:MAG: helix-turn-helix domain-containing protein [Actinobacteria bacterium]|nr:helix-turn-helix domain-containing protein [Actinomycetota bacterium]